MTALCSSQITSYALYCVEPDNTSHSYSSNGGQVTNSRCDKFGKALDPSTDRSLTVDETSFGSESAFCGEDIFTINLIPIHKSDNEFYIANPLKFTIKINVSVSGSNGSQKEYILYSETQESPFTFTHDEFSIIANYNGSNNNPVNCGNFVYAATYDGSSVTGVSLPPISYNAATR